MKKFLFSSADPNEVALTVKGMLLSIVPLLTVVLPVLGVSFDVGAFQAFANSLVNMVQTVTVAVSSTMVVYGLLRKAYYAVFNRA